MFFVKIDYIYYQTPKGVNKKNKTFKQKINMANKNKSIIEEAKLDAKRIQEALNANTKEILRSIAKEEINDVVKESLNEFDEEDVDVDMDVEDGEVDMDAEAPVDVDTDSAEMDTLNVDDEDSLEMGDSEEGDLAIGDEEEGMGVEASYGDEMDMTTASDDDVIAVYKKLTGDDEIQIVSNEAGDIELTVNEPGEFVIKTNNAGVNTDAVEAPEMATDLDLDLDAELDGGEGDEYELADSGDLGIDSELEGGEEEEDKEEYEESYDMNESQVVYEIAIDEMEDIESIGAPVGNENEDNWAGDNLEGGFDDNGQNGTGDSHGEHIMEEEEIDESIPKGVGEAHREPAKANIGQPVAPGAKGVHGVKGGATNENQFVSKADYDKLLKEAKSLKSKASQMAETLQSQRKMLGQIVVFNTNLTNVTRLFTEHSTTKDEKRSIIERFDDEVTNIQESKRLFKTIEKELGNKQPISESVEGKFSKETSGSSSNLNENTAYVDKDTKRIMDLIKRVENKEKY
jgi:hypothetical protein